MIKDMITEDYCSFEVAKLLKEKGFKIDTNRDYWKIGEDGTMYFMSSIGAYTSNPNEVYAIYRPENSYPCPTLQMAMKWLREVHHLHIDVGFGNDYKGEFLYMGDIYDLTKDAIHAKYEPIIEPDDYLSTNPKTYEEAVEAALKFCLENLI